MILNPGYTLEPPGVLMTVMTVTPESYHRSIKSEPLDIGNAASIFAQSSPDDSNIQQELRRSVF